MQQQLSLSAVLLQMGAQPGRHCTVVVLEYCNQGALWFRDSWALLSPGQPCRVWRDKLSRPPLKWPLLLPSHLAAPRCTCIPTPSAKPYTTMRGNLMDTTSCAHCRTHTGTVLQAIQSGAFSAERSAEAHPQLLALLYTALEVALGMEYLHSQVWGHGLVQRAQCIAGAQRQTRAKGVMRAARVRVSIGGPRLT